MVSASELRYNARKSLSGRWGTAVIALIIYGLIYGAASGTGVGGLILYGPLTLGLSMFLLNLVRGKKVIFDSLFDGFGHFVNSLVLGLLKIIFTALWTLLFIIPGIVKSYSYSMSFYIMSDNPQMDGSEALRESMKMMDGNKWRLFCLDLSFIGWIILSVFTLGILMLWIAPYMETAHVHFYESLKGNYTEKDPA